MEFTGVNLSIHFIQLLYNLVEAKINDDIICYILQFFSNKEKKFEKLIKKINHLLSDLRYFKEIFMKDVNYDHIKSHKKAELHPLSLSEECFFWKNHREEGQIEAHQPFYGLFINAIILIFISCESLILGESKHVYYRKDSQYFLYIGVKTPAIGNLDNFSVFMNDEGNILKICTCSLLFSKDIWEVFLQGLKLFKIKEPQIFHLRHFIIKYYN